MILSINASGKYDIVIERNSLSKAKEYLNLDRKCLIVSDDNIPTTYINIVKDQCKEALTFIIKNGEESKNINNFENILSFMIDNNFTRTDCVIAIGGGVVGDLSGFVAACYMRGIDFYNIPTTLLSQVDSSIGGKTAIDYHNVKNIIGAFYQPKKVLIDSNTLATLDKRQLHAGLVEAYKMALCFDKDLVDFIEKSKNLNDDLDEIIYKSLLIKKYVVENDEKETGIRKVLNYGHTFGHAIEAFKNLKYLHGECVGMGMLYVSSDLVKKHIFDFLKKYDLPIDEDINTLDLIEYIKHDKKASSNIVSLIIVDKIGEYIIKKENIDNLNTYSLRSK